MFLAITEKIINLGHDRLKFSDVTERVIGRFIMVRITISFVIQTDHTLSCLRHLSRSFNPVYTLSKCTLIVDGARIFVVTCET